MKPLYLLALAAACATGAPGTASEAPAFLVATPSPTVGSARVAMQSVTVDSSLPVREVRQFVVFDANDHVTAVCLLVLRMNGTQLAIPFPDSALAWQRNRC